MASFNSVMKKIQENPLIIGNPSAAAGAVAQDPEMMKKLGLGGLKNPFAKTPYESLGLEELYSGITPPELSPLELEQVGYAGDVNFNPTGYESIGTAFDDLNWSREGEDAQLASMAALSEIIDGGGLSLSDQATLAKVNQDVGTADRGRRDAILQNMQARGMAGGGNELLAQLQSSQAATDQQAQAGLQQAGMAQERALQAIMQKGDIGRNFSNDSFGQQATIAGQKDRIGEFNARTGLQNQQFNSSGALQAGMSNRDAKQGVMTTNTGITNQQKTNAQMLPQQGFQNQLAVAGGIAGARTAEQAGRNAQTANDNQRNAGYISGIGSIVQGGATAMAAPASDERDKQNVAPINDADLEEFFASFEPKEFDYRDPGAPGQTPGRKAGFIAQDVQPTSLGKILLKAERGDKLAYDPQVLDGIMLAAISKLMRGGL